MAEYLGTVAQGGDTALQLAAAGFESLSLGVPLGGSSGYLFGLTQINPARATSRSPGSLSTWSHTPDGLAGEHENRVGVFYSDNGGYPAPWWLRLPRSRSPRALQRGLVHREYQRQLHPSGRHNAYKILDRARRKWHSGDAHRRDVRRGKWQPPDRLHPEYGRQWRHAAGDVARQRRDGVGLLQLGGSLCRAGDGIGDRGTYRRHGPRRRSAAADRQDRRHERTGYRAINITGTDRQRTPTSPPRHPGAGRPSR